MIRPGRPTRPPLALDAFGSAAGLAIVCGALAIVVPFLVAVTGTLTAIAVAAWAIARASGEEARRLRHSSTAAAAVGLAVAAVLYLAPPPHFGPYRALVLALVTAVFWASETGRIALLTGAGR
ncbi:MAG TPA: hypothetical protein VML53_05700 [Thermoplasmata archaeon]|nr:hypothetical protein [Thermoplasmata archaeon]